MLLSVHFSFNQVSARAAAHDAVRETNARASLGFDKPHFRTTLGIRFWNERASFVSGDVTLFVGTPSPNILSIHSKMATAIGEIPKKPVNFAYDHTIPS